MSIGIDESSISFVVACLGPILTLLVYQWKHYRDTDAVLNKMGVLLYDREMIQKLIVHLAAEDPIQAGEERRKLEKRIAEIEEVLRLLASKDNLEKLIAQRASLLGKS